jgi:PmbA protein
MKVDVLALCERGVRLGERWGASEVEAYGSLHAVRGVDFKDKIEATRSAVFAGLGIRLALGKRLGFYASSQVTESGVEQAVQRALTVAKVTQLDPEWQSFPTTYGKAAVTNIFDRKIVDMTVETLSEKAVVIMDHVHDVDERTTITQGAVGVSEERVAISNSYHCALERQSTYASASVTVTAEAAEKKGQSSEAGQWRTWREIEGQELARQASERALAMLDARPMGSGRTTVVWRNQVFADVLAIMFGRTLAADAVQKQRSPWIGKIGATIASEDVTVLDEGVKDAGLGTQEFDDEGYPQQNTSLITRGVLANYLYDNYTAKKEGTASTGNASRSYRSIPTPSTTNLTLKPGGASLEDLLRDTKRGLYVVEVIGDWLSNPISGDLSATVTNGYLIDKGELTQAVKGVLVAANFFTLLRDEATRIADDIENSGATYAPSVQMQNLKVIGT